MLIIAEKPSVAKKISQYLSRGNYRRIQYKRKVNYYVFNLNNEKVYVVSALGHLFTLSDRNKTLEYPTFNYIWVPAYEEDKIYIKKQYIDLIKKFSNEREIIIATDYDIEGELIGYNILRFILNRKNAYRMIFSAITPIDIWNSFINKKDSIDFNFAIAGETRHIVDWLYGINLSRALTKAIRYYNKKIVLSIGRVQGPTLKLVYEKELEIRNFKPEYYYILEAEIIKNNKVYKFKHKIAKFSSKDEAEKIKNSIKNYLTISNIEKSIEKISPPYPYNLTDLQTDAYKFYKISPKKTLDIAQKLYEKGYISYPRTSSQKIPKTINILDILENLKQILSYRPFISILLKKERLEPNNGPKDDVHPAIHPTGLIPTNVSKLEWLIYDLIVRRFLATFMDKAIIEKIKVLTKEGFYYEYKRVIEKGWLSVYWIWIKDDFEDEEFRIGEKLSLKSIKIRKKKTSPPPRYNPASLVKKMEEINIGTKATRADIVQILYKRKYIKDRSIKITELGEKIIQIFDKYFPEILDVNLTKKLEKELEKIEKGKIDYREKVIQETREIVKSICYKIKEKEKEIGKELYEMAKTL